MNTKKGKRKRMKRKQKKARNLVVLGMIIHTKPGRHKDKRRKRSKDDWRKDQE